MSNSGSGVTSRLRWIIASLIVLICIVYVVSITGKSTSTFGNSPNSNDIGLRDKVWTGNYSSFTASKWDPGMQNELIVTDQMVIWRSLPAKGKEVVVCRARFKNTPDDSTSMFSPFWSCSDGVDSRGRLIWNRSDTTWTLVDGPQSDYAERFVFQKTFSTR